MNPVTELPSARAGYRHYPQASRGVHRDLDGEPRERFAGAVKRHRVVQRGEYLFMQSDAFDTLYLLRSGSLKSHMVDIDGDEQVLGFHLPGDVLGLDAIGADNHQRSAVALETVSVCELSLARLEALCAGGETARPHALYQLLGSEIARDYRLLRLLGKKHAEQRLSGFLNQLSQRFADSGYAADDFQLSMSRRDIGDYLGLALETVSRLFSRLQKQGVLVVDGRHVKIVDRALLAAKAGEVAPEPRRYAC